jgi:hypothetical protein
MIDLVISRKEIKLTITQLLAILLKRQIEPILLDYRPENAPAVA